MVQNVFQFSARAEYLNGNPCRKYAMRLRRQVHYFEDPDWQPCDDSSRSTSPAQTTSEWDSTDDEQVSGRKGKKNKKKQMKKKKMPAATSVSPHAVREAPLFMSLDLDKYYIHNFSLRLALLTFSLRTHL